MTYAAAGVDIDAGDAAVERIKGHLDRTHGPRVMGRHGAFAGMLRLDSNPLFSRNYDKPVLVSCCDGVGTKIKLAADLGIHHTIGQDCVAMNVNDLIVQGAEPLMFLDYVGVHRVDPAEMEQIVRGVADGCALADCALLGGETSEMPDVYTAGDYDLAGFAVGVVELDRVIDGPAAAREGDVVLGLGSSGIHSNGYTLVRAIAREKNLDLHAVHDGYADDPVAGGRPLGEALLEPTRIYVRAVRALLDDDTLRGAVHGMAHITGGGLPGNLNRALPDTLDAQVDTGAWAVPSLFRFLQDAGNVDEAEMFRVFNMGIGFCIVIDPAHADAATGALEAAGEAVHRLGVLTPGTGIVRIN